MHSPQEELLLPQKADPFVFYDYPLASSSDISYLFTVYSNTTNPGFLIRYDSQLESL